MKNFFSARPVQILIIIALIFLFWYPICFNNDFFMDDGAFLDVFKAGVPAIGYFFTPHNEHFMPLFKVIFLSMFKLFGLNIAPYMALSIIMHAANCVIFYLLLGLIFPQRKFLPFLLILFFGLNTVYFEILHWFTTFSQALMLCFLLSTLLLLHLGQKKQDKRLYYLSLFTSFFIPMNFSLGFLGIIFIYAYNKLIIDKEIRIFKLYPYIFVWLTYLAIYLSFTLNQILTKSTATSVNIGTAIQYLFLGFVGMSIKLLGFSILVFPFSTGISVLLTLLLLFFVVFFFMYFMLNNKNARIGVFKNGEVCIFAFSGMFLSYALIAVSRTALSADSFLNWGRYHYLPMMFFTILLGAIIPQILGILALIYSRRRVIVLFAIILIMFLANHFILIRQKSESAVRTEGAISVKYLCA